jgi:hypothetical protein
MYVLLRGGITETWTNSRGTTRTRTIYASPLRFASRADRSRFEASGNPVATLAPDYDTTIVGTGSVPGTRPLFTADELTRLPTRPESLYRRIRMALRASIVDERRALSGAMPPSDVGGVASGPTQLNAPTELAAIAALLAAPLRPRLRAALYRAATAIPGIRADAKARDILGRIGFGVSAGSRETAFELIFNPGTGELLGQRSSFAGDRAIVMASPTTSIGARPRGSAAAPGPRSLKPVRLTVSPHNGEPRSIFTMRVSQPARRSIYSFVISPPLTAGCREIAPSSPQPAVERHRGRRSMLSKRLSPAISGVTAWCAGVHRVRVFAADIGQSARLLGAVNFTVR